MIRAFAVAATTCVYVPALSRIGEAPALKLSGERRHFRQRIGLIFAFGHQAAKVTRCGSSGVGVPYLRSGTRLRK